MFDIFCVFTDDDQAATPTGSATPTIPRRENLSLADTEVAKIFDRLKFGSSRKPADIGLPISGASVADNPQGKPMLAMIRTKLKAKKRMKLSSGGKENIGSCENGGQEGLGKRAHRLGVPPFPPAGSEDSSISVLCSEIVEELGAGELLIQFCRDLPVIRELVGGTGELSSFLTGAPGEDEGETGLAPLIKGLVIWWQCVFEHNRSVWYVFCKIPTQSCIQKIRQGVEKLKFSKSLGGGHLT